MSDFKRETLADFYERVNKELEKEQGTKERVDAILAKMDILAGGNVSSEAIHKIFKEVNLEDIKGEPGESITVESETKDAHGNTLVTFSNGQSITISKGSKGDSVRIASINKADKTTTIRFSTGEVVNIKDGNPISVKSYDQDAKGDTLVTFTDDTTVKISKGKDGTLDISSLSEQQISDFKEKIGISNSISISEDLLVDNTPNYYKQSHNKQILFELKTNKVVGVSNSDVYGILKTSIAGLDKIVIQKYTPLNKTRTVYLRYSESDNLSWTNWIDISPIKRNLSGKIDEEELPNTLEPATNFEAEAGTDNTKYMTPLRTFEAIKSFGFSEKLDKKVNIADLEEEKKDLENAKIAIAHLVDPGKDLVQEENKLYRYKIVVESHEPIIRKIEVGRKIKNSGLVYKITTPLNRVRVFFKAKLSNYADDDSYLAMWLGDGTNEEKRWISKVESRTRHYSIDLDVVDSDELTISTLTAYDKDVEIWDFDVVGGGGRIHD